MGVQAISEKTGISIGLLITVMGAIGGGVLTASVAIYRVGALETAQLEHKIEEKEVHQTIAVSVVKVTDRQDKDQAERATLQRQVDSVQNAVTRANEKLDDVKDSLKDLKNNGIVTAKGRP